MDINKETFIKFVKDYKEKKSNISEKDYKIKNFIENDVAIDKIIKKNKENNNYTDVLVKVTVINSLYSTRFYGENLHNITKFIIDNDFDKSLKGTPIEVSNFVMNNNKVGNVKYISFFSKYCNLHTNKCPIYDNDVARLLKTLWEKNCFKDCLDNNTLISKYKTKKVLGIEFLKNNYNTFYLLLIQQVISWLDLQENDFKQADEYLWFYAKQTQQKN